MARKSYDPYVQKWAAKYKVDPKLVHAIIRAESGGNVRAGSSAGAKGLMQLMDATGRGLGVRDPFNPNQNVMGGTKYISNLLKKYKGDTRKALAAYNAGPGNVDKYGGIPPFAETQTYVKRVLGYWKEAGGGGSPMAAAPAGRARVRSPLDTGGAGSGFTEQQRAVLGGMFDDSPIIQLALQQLTGSPVAGMGSLPTARRRRPGGGGGGGGGRATAKDWRDLQRIGRNRFGLENDPGNSQTNGGRHTRGSEHYDDRAIDFGTARNSIKQLKRAMRWYKAHGYDVLWEGDHLHVSLPGSGI